MRVIIDGRTLDTMDDVRSFNHATGHHFFEPAALRFFKSRVSDKLHGRRYFVTSEQGPDMPRLWTVRYIDRDGSTGDVGGDGRFDTRSSAHTAARSCADAGSRISVHRDPYPGDANEHGEPDPVRFEWRPYIYARGGTYPVGNRTTRADADQGRAWLLRPRFNKED